MGIFAGSRRKGSRTAPMQLGAVAVGLSLCLWPAHAQMSTCEGTTNADPSLLATSCTATQAALLAVRPSDSSATAETTALYQNLVARAGRPLFGLQTENRADIERVTGSPGALSGFDFRSVVRANPPGSAGDRVRFTVDAGEADRIRAGIQGAYARGEMITLSWHMSDPISGGNFASYPGELRGGATPRRPRVAEVLREGTPARAAFLEQLNQFADFVQSLRDPSGRPIPVVFRPFHEQTGSWFWWGSDHCSPEEYRDLYRLTINHLRRDRDVHQLLVAWSPADHGDQTSTSYYQGYPGDSYVDIFGLDAYHSFDDAKGVRTLGRQISWMAEQARRHGKVSALTEVGALGEEVDRSRWYTERLGRALAAGAGSSISYIMAWRNNGASGSTREDCFPASTETPENRARLADFQAFRANHRVALLRDLPGSLYGPPRLPPGDCR